MARRSGGAMESSRLVEYAAVESGRVPVQLPGTEEHI